MLHQVVYQSTQTLGYICHALIHVLNKDRKCEFIYPGTINNNSYSCRQDVFIFRALACGQAAILTLCSILSMQFSYCKSRLNVKTRDKTRYTGELSVFRLMKMMD